MSTQPATPREIREIRETLETAPGPDGTQLTLSRADGGFAVWSDGRLAIASAARRAEREMVPVGLAPLRDRNDVTVLLGGLGMGYLLAGLLADQRVVRVDVVEHAHPLIEWNRTHLSTLHQEPPLGDPRVHLHAMGFVEYLRALRYGSVAGLPADFKGYLAIFLDLDDGPSALSRSQNGDLYSEDGLADLEDALRSGGVLAVWSAKREMEFLSRLQGRFQNVAEIAVPVDVPGSGLDYIYRARRRPPIAKTPGRAQA